jgi:hypothetical protein
MIKHLTIPRIVTGTSGTFGVLIFQSIPFALTLERQWLNNRPSIGDVPGSCIPAGDYVCNRVNSPRFGDTFEVSNVRGRSHILFHKGNIDDDSRGCILVGEEYGQISSNSGIKSSAAGYGEFMAILAGDTEFKLTIKDCF